MKFTLSEAQAKELLEGKLLHFFGKLSFLAFHAIKVKLKGKVASAQRVEHKTKSLYAFAMKNVFDE